MFSDKRFKVAVLIFALAGTIFSGYLSYYNYFGGGCEKALITCGTGPNAVLIFGQPSCIYGFFMFLITAIIVLSGWAKKELAAKAFVTAIFWVGLVGVLFSGGLSFYELVILKTGVYGLPACVYGLIFYLGVFISDYLWKSKLSGLSAPAAPVTTPPTSTPSV